MTSYTQLTPPSSLVLCLHSLASSVLLFSKRQFSPNPALVAVIYAWPALALVITV
jgi:hypothetical protein